ncbi:MAG: GFA family protein [Candidatus Marinimicrobia bacterium]|jgi:hypothetical protein|nr:GFA family protein [Candidatus Neomarinimicrobiota bacterium]MBT3693048.1 GFA family protein [Candidatus Neomarinimicrobiota bacterium]MBT4177134.1 GFA family protein [Candidatus Neomarinimicrobiota bacterium]MBT4593741.1 GFA family protein [Candidatus Neomarinimicrobiota bacterium]MBT5355694.1 GFA family protein [Candidatus Neomarinimicrobiota bacterium]
MNPIESNLNFAVASKNQMKGKCFCGKHRFVISGEPYRVVHCHCKNCQRSVGAAFVTWIVIKRNQYAIKPEAKRHQASNQAIRTFCDTCGSSLTYAHPERADYLDITAGTINHPNSLKPDWHIWGKRKVEWIKLHDDLPFYEQFPDN